MKLAADTGEYKTVFGDLTAFRWSRLAITDDMLKAVANVVLEWSMLEQDFIKLTRVFWHHYGAGSSIPRSFDARKKALRDFSRTLYAEEPEELRAFLWFLQRLADANGKRDDICHGIPGEVRRRGKTYKCLAIYHPSKPTRYTPVSVARIKRLHAELIKLDNELSEVMAATDVAIQASRVASGETRVWQGFSSHRYDLTPGNRSPMLPKHVPPPATFRV
ncbi:MAG: hypothetical protein WBO55_11780 [Rhizobiaceae bacterium]